jgi:hypothetical protein
MEDTLQHVEKSTTETWRHIDRQRHIIEILQEHGQARDVSTAENDASNAHEQPGSPLQAEGDPAGRNAAAVRSGR